LSGGLNSKHPKYANDFDDSSGLTEVIA